MEKNLKKQIPRNLIIPSEKKVTNFQNGTVKLFKKMILSNIIKIS